MIEITQPIFLIFIAVATGASYWFGKKEGKMRGMEEVIIDLMNDGFVDKDGIFIEREDRNKK